MPSAIPLSVFQVKPGFENPDLILPDRQDARIQMVPVTVDGHRVGDLYVKTSISHEPRWLAYLEGHADTEDLQLHSSSAAAVLLMSADARLYAITFGYGHTLLADDALESAFG